MTDSSSTHEQFRAAYKAWKDASEAHNAKMELAIKGEVQLNLAETLDECEELARLHSDWMAKSKPFVHWR